MNNIVLIGFMCSGKTTIGRLLANELDYSFIDTDYWISKETDLTIDEIFASKGEEYFRKLETETVKNFSNNLKNTVLSTGGGLSVREVNIPYLKEIGQVVYLQVSKDTVLDRLNPNVVRPLLEQDNQAERIEELLKIRRPIYEAVADIIIDTDNKSVEAVTREVRQSLS